VGDTLIASAILLVAAGISILMLATQQKLLGQFLVWLGAIALLMGATLDTQRVTRVESAGEE
jgi:hypothetical protein